MGVTACGTVGVEEWVVGVYVCESCSIWELWQVGVVACENRNVLESLFMGIVLCGSRESWDCKLKKLGL